MSVYKTEWSKLYPQVFVELVLTELSEQLPNSNVYHRKPCCASTRCVIKNRMEREGVREIYPTTVTEADWY